MASEVRSQRSTEKWDQKHFQRSLSYIQTETRVYKKGGKNRNTRIFKSSCGELHGDQFWWPHFLNKVGGRGYKIRGENGRCMAWLYDISD